MPPSTSSRTRSTDLRIGDDALALADLRTAGFELWLDEQHHRSPRLAQRHQRRDDHAQRDERQVADHDVDAAPDLLGGGVTDVAAFEVRDPRIGTQPFVQLAVPDVERDDVRRAALQQTVGEPTGRCAGVERAQAGHVDGEHRQRMVELLGAPSDEPRRRAVDDHGVGRRHLARRLVGDRAVDEHAVVADQRLRLGAAADELAADEFGVEPSPWCHSTSGSGGAGCLLRRALLRRSLLGGALLGRCLLRGGLLRRSLLRGGAFFAGAFLAAPSSPGPSSLRGAFLAEVFLTTTRAEAEGTRSASCSVSASNRFSSSSKRSDIIATCLATSRCTLAEIRSDVSRPRSTNSCTIRSASRRWTSPLSTNCLTNASACFARDLGELDAGVDQLLDGGNLHRRMLVILARARRSQRRAGRRHRASRPAVRRLAPRAESSRCAPGRTGIRARSRTCRRCPSDRRPSSPSPGSNGDVGVREHVGDQ